VKEIKTEEEEKEFVMDAKEKRKRHSDEISDKDTRNNVIIKENSKNRHMNIKCTLEDAIGEEELEGTGKRWRVDINGNIDPNFSQFSKIENKLNQIKTTPLTLIDPGMFVSDSPVPPSSVRSSCGTSERSLHSTGSNRSEGSPSLVSLGRPGTRSQRSKKSDSSSGSLKSYTSDSSLFNVHTSPSSSNLVSTTPTLVSSFINKQNLPSRQIGSPTLISSPSFYPALPSMSNMTSAEEKYSMFGYKNRLLSPSADIFEDGQIDCGDNQMSFNGTPMVNNNNLYIPSPSSLQYNLTLEENVGSW
jgi:hypothetical protein